MLSKRSGHKIQAAAAPLDQLQLVFQCYSEIANLSFKAWLLSIHSKSHPEVQQANPTIRFTNTNWPWKTSCSYTIEEATTCLPRLSFLALIQSHIQNCTRQIPESKGRFSNVNWPWKMSCSYTTEATAGCLSSLLRYCIFHSQYMLLVTVNTVYQAIHWNQWKITKTNKHWFQLHFFFTKNPWYTLHHATLIQILVILWFKW